MAGLLKFGLVLLFAGSVLMVRESAKPGPNAAHEDDEGGHNEDYDHESILGSEDLEEEYAGLAPEVARERLEELVDKHDKDKDEKISKAELNAWIAESFLNLDKEEAMGRFEDDDENQDGNVTYVEIMAKSFDLDPEAMEELKRKVEDPSAKKDEDYKDALNTLKMISEEKKVFDAADLDQDNGLNFTEYLAFAFPHNFEHMHQVEMENYIRDHDDPENPDGFISQEEFVPKDVSAESELSSKEQFQELDKDKDGKLTPEELKPFVLPSQDENVDEEVSHLMNMADDNEDEILSKDEILNRVQEFVGSSATDYGAALNHDEL